MLALMEVTQVDVLEEYQLLIVLSGGQTLEGWFSLTLTPSTLRAYYHDISS